MITIIMFNEVIRTTVDRSLFFVVASDYFSSTILFGQIIQIMKLILYSTTAASPPARAVELIAKIAGIELECRNVDLLKKEQCTEWFSKLNPMGYVPVLDDNGFILPDSHAIIAYLLTVYAPKHILEQYYPTEPKQRGIVDANWNFESGILFPRLKAIFAPLLLKGEKVTPIENIEWLADGIDRLEKMLEGKRWIAGDRLTVADISAVTSLDLIDEILIPINKFKNVSEWADRVRRECPFWDEINTARVKQTVSLITGKAGVNASDRWKQLVQSSLRK